MQPNPEDVHAFGAGLSADGASRSGSESKGPSSSAHSGAATSVAKLAVPKAEDAPKSEPTDPAFLRDRAKPTPPTKTIGQAGFASFGGFIVENERASSLTGVSKYRTFIDILANVAIAAASVRSYLNVVGGATWSVEPADDGADAKRYADLVEEMLFEELVTPLARVARKAAMHRIYGFSFQEWTAKKRDDGVIGLRDIEARAQHTIERWDTDVSGTVIGVEQWAPQSGKGIYIPRAKAVYLVDDALTDAPMGMGIMRHVVPSAEILQRYQQLEGFGFETDMRGIPIGRIPYGEIENDPNLTAPQKLKLREAIEEIVKKHVKTPALGLVIDSIVYKSSDESKTPSSTYKYSLDLLKGEANAHEEIAAAIARMCLDIAILFGTEWMLLGGDKGSYALSKDKTSMFKLVCDGSLSDVAEAFNRDLIGPIFAMNGWDRKQKPRLVPAKTQRATIQEITAALRDLSAAFGPASPTDPAQDVVRELLGLPAHEVIEVDDDLSLRGKDDPLDGTTADDGDPDAEDAGAEADGASVARAGARAAVAGASAGARARIASRRGAGARGSSGAGARSSRGSAAARGERLATDEDGNPKKDAPKGAKTKKRS